MPPSQSTNEAPEVILDALPHLAWWVRGSLVGLVAGLVLVFFTAAHLNPYQGDGSARTMETHMQLGLPPCTFKTMTGGVPCPSCGMTTSFALLIRGDVWNSMRANFVGTLLASVCLLFIPWSLASVWLGRPVFITSMENALVRIVIVFLALMLLRWAVVLIWFWASRGG
jgi:hypothetical protein